MKKKYKRSFKEDIKLIVKGYKLLWKMSPANVIWRFLYCISYYIPPYFALYMSALIVDEIVLGASFERLFKLAVITVAGNFALNILAQTVIGRIAVHYERVQWYRNEKMMTDAESRMQYKHMEDPEIALQASKIRHYTYYGSNGIMQLYWSIWFVTRGVFNLIASVTLTASMFSMAAHGDYSGFLAFANSPLSALAIVGLVVINIIIQVKCSANQRKKSKNAWNDFSTDNEKAYSMLGSNPEDMHIFNTKDFILERTKHVFVRPEYITKTTKINAYYTTIGIIWNTVMTLALFLYVGAKAYIGVFGIGSFILYRGTVEKFIDAVSVLGSHLGGMRYNNDYLVELFDYLNLPNEMTQGTEEVEKGKYTIEFRNVSFKYSGADEYALKNVSFKFSMGERLAFVGMNGSGKTTFIKLLCRLYEPTEGEILLNGKNIKDYKYDQYLNLFSVVFQDYAIFAYDVAANVSASHNPDRERVMDCLIRAGLGDKINKMEKGIDTFVSREYADDGVDFSRGESQKLAIARALYKNAPFIILDEPTAALDPIAEAEIYGRFNELVTDRTAVYISHRLSSCKFCDRIVVFHQGEILQCGSHDFLIADEKGKYHQLWTAQAQYYTE